MAEYKTTVTETEDGGRTITSGNMTEEQAAKLAAKRERTKNMNTSDSASVASDALDKDIAAKNYSFSAGQFFDVKIDYFNISSKDFSNEMKSFSNEIEKLFDQSKKSDNEIKNQLKKLKFESK